MPRRSRCPRRILRTDCPTHQLPAGLVESDAVRVRQGVRRHWRHEESERPATARMAGDPLHPRRCRWRCSPARHRLLLARATWAVRARPVGYRLRPFPLRRPERRRRPWRGTGREGRGPFRERTRCRRAEEYARPSDVDCDPADREQSSREVRRSVNLEPGGSWWATTSLPGRDWAGETGRDRSGSRRTPDKPSSNKRSAAAGQRKAIGPTSTGPRNASATCGRSSTQM